MKVDGFGEEPIWKRGGENQESPRSSTASPVLLLGAGAIILIVVGLLSIPRTAPEPETPVAAPPLATVAATPPQRNTYSREITEITSLIQQGKYATATDLAETHVRSQINPPSPEARATLAGLSYHATMSGLYVPAEDLGQAAFARWRDAHVRAEVHGVSPRTAPLTVSQTAAGASLWLLARGAFLKAWESGSVKPTDLNEVSNYYALLRNLGGAMGRQTSSEAKNQAAVFLRTADAISEGYGLGRGEARGDLVEMLGPDITRWPLALEDDPVLAARLKR